MTIRAQKVAHMFNMNDRSLEHDLESFYRRVNDTPCPPFDKKRILSRAPQNVKQNTRRTIALTFVFTFLGAGAAIAARPDLFAHIALSLARVMHVPIGHLTRASEQEIDVSKISGEAAFHVRIPLQLPDGRHLQRTFEVGAQRRVYEGVYGSGPGTVRIFFIAPLSRIARSSREASRYVDVVTPYGLENAVDVRSKEIAAPNLDMVALFPAAAPLTAEDEQLLKKASQ